MASHCSCDAALASLQRQGPIIALAPRCKTAMTPAMRQGPCRMVHACTPGPRPHPGTKLAPEDKACAWPTRRPPPRLPSNSPEERRTSEHQAPSCVCSRPRAFLRDAVSHRQTQAQPTVGDLPLHAPPPSSQPPNHPTRQPPDMRPPLAPLTWLRPRHSPRSAESALSSHIPPGSVPPSVPPSSFHICPPSSEM